MKRWPQRVRILLLAKPRHVDSSLAFTHGGHQRPNASSAVPDWVKSCIDRWTEAAQIESGSLFRCVTKYGTVGGKDHRESDLARRSQIPSAVNSARLRLMI
jgi:hypothetical protein